MTLKFNKKKHVYTFKGKRLSPVTEWIKTFFTPFDPSIAKYIAKARRAKGEKVTAWDVKREWKKSGTDGTEVHKCVQDFVDAGMIHLGDYLKLPPKAQVGCNVVVHEAKRFKDPSLFSEFVVFDEKLGLAGTIDLIINENGVLNLYDFKTNKEIRVRGKHYGTRKSTKNIEDCNYMHYSLQLNVYAYLLNRMGFEIGELSIIHLQNDGAHTIYQVPGMFSVVEDMLKEDGRL